MPRLDKDASSEDYEEEARHLLEKKTYSEDDLQIAMVYGILSLTAAVRESAVLFASLAEEELEDEEDEEDDE